MCARTRAGDRFSIGMNRNGGSASVSRETGKGHQELTNTRRVIEACWEDIIALWNHPAVRKGLDEHNVALKFQSGLYVSDHIGLFPPRCPTNQPSLPLPVLSPTHTSFSPFRPFVNTGHHGAWSCPLPATPNLLQFHFILLFLGRSRHKRPCHLN